MEDFIANALIDDSADNPDVQKNDEDDKMNNEESADAMRNADNAIWND